MTAKRVIFEESEDKKSIVIMTSGRKGHYIVIHEEVIDEGYLLKSESMSEEEVNELKENYPKIVTPRDVEESVSKRIEEEFDGEVTYNFDTKRFIHNGNELSVIYNPEMVTDLLVYPTLAVEEEVFSILKTYIEHDINK